MKIPLPWLKERVDAGLPVEGPEDRPVVPGIGAGGPRRAGGALGTGGILRFRETAVPCPPQS